jgi:hypothetical protein
MSKKLKNDYQQLVIDDGQSSMIVTTRLSKIEFENKLKTNRLKPYSSTINYHGNLTNNIFNPSY